ncbi:MAG: GGDEF domain-containing protein [Pirellulales bacterium]
MMNSTLTIVVVGCLMGAVQFAAGIAVGMWLRRGDKADAHRGRQDMLNANRIAQRLQALAGEVSVSVGEHQQRIEQASEQLSSEADRDDESITELVVDVIGGIVRANHNLQTKLETAEHRLQEQAVEIEQHISRSLTDPLTGLPNRREFNERLEERMAGWNRRGEVFSLLMLDVDHFKKLNDRHGHLAGDVVLTMLGRSLRGILRRDDAIARYGGEEFAMILPGTQLDQATLVVPKVCDATARATVNHGGTRLNVTLSGGLATIQKGETAESLIGRADAALYAAKTAGRNCVFIHDGANCRPVSTPRQAVSTSQKAPTTTEPRDSLSIATDPVNDDFAAPAEPVSAELAQACEDLRQYLRLRGTENAEAVASR